MRALFLSIVLAAVAAQDTEYATLHIASPDSLKAQFPNGVMLKPAMFGAPMKIDFHAKKMSGPLAYAPSDDSNGCKPLNSSEFSHPMTDYILMVDRGACDFVLKVQHVQDLGAKAAIIVDNNPENWLPFMADDGAGSSITIPSILIRQKDGKAISSSFGPDEPVIVELAWNIPSPDNNVEWELWTTSVDDSEDFKRNFDKVEKVFGNATLFTPHYVISTIPSCQNLTATKESELPPNCDCSNNGRYCATTYSTKYTAFESLQEDLRQICLWKAVNGTSAEPIWWDYVEEFMDACIKRSNVTNECSVQALARVAPSGFTHLVGKMTKCVIDSGGSTKLGPVNKLFEAEVAALNDRKILQVPSVLINGMPFYGGLACPPPAALDTCHLLSVLCMGFKNPENISACNTQPDCKLGQVRDTCNVCGGTGSFDACGFCFQAGDEAVNKSCAGCDGVPNSGLKDDVCGVCGGPGRDACNGCGGPVDAKYCYGEAKPAIPTWGVVLIVVAVICVVAIGVFFFMQHRQNALRQDIDALMQQYLPLDVNK